MLSGTPNDEAKMRAEFLAISSENEVDIAFQEDNVFRRNRRLVVFDMDSTLIVTKNGSPFARNAEDWLYWHESVPKKMRVVFAMD